MQQSLKTAEMHLQISHDTPASMVGTTRSRITYFRNRFRQRCLIDYKGSVNTAAHIYAPLSKVTISGTPGYTGWLIGKQLNFKGTSKLHYDETGKDQTPFSLRLVK